jgi:hypothetical protein
VTTQQPWELLTRLDQATTAVTAAAREALSATAVPGQGGRRTTARAVLARINEPDAVTRVALAVDDPRGTLDLAADTVITPEIRALAAIAVVTGLVTGLTRGAR